MGPLLKSHAIGEVLVYCCVTCVPLTKTLNLKREVECAIPSLRVPYRV